MNKQEFLDGLKAGLWSMPEADQQRSIDYYTEMIDDRMEEGLSEEEAVAAIGELDEIIKQILTESPRPPQVVKSAQEEKPQQNNNKVWLIILLILGSPLWIPLLASVAGTAIGIYVSLWSAVIGLYAATLALGIAAVGCIFGSFFMVSDGALTMVVAWGAAMVCAGLAILLLLLANLAARGMVKLTKLAWNWVFRRKERAV